MMRHTQLPYLQCTTENRPEILNGDLGYVEKSRPWFLTIKPSQHGGQFKSESEYEVALTSINDIILQHPEDISCF